MKIAFAISQWNFCHYAGQVSLERVIETTRQQGYGFELWATWGDQTDLFDQAWRQRLGRAVEGMAVSMHTAGRCAEDFQRHKKQIDTAAAVGAKVIVLHGNDVTLDDAKGPDPAIMARAVQYAEKRGVRLALENGALEFMAEAFDRCPRLGWCLDIGHVYVVGQKLRDFLDAFKSRLIHLHIQDILPEDESAVPGAWADHYTPGTGAIPAEDWKLLAETLRQIDFEGMAVFETHPRNPFQEAHLARRFVQGLLAGQP